MKTIKEKTNVQDPVKKVQDILDKSNISADVYQIPGDNAIAVSIDWGDWKHDHLRATWLLEEAGFEEVSSVVTEEDGSDTYSAIHLFCKEGEDLYDHFD